MLCSLHCIHRNTERSVWCFWSPILCMWNLYFWNLICMPSGFIANGVSFGTISSTGTTSGSKTMLLSGRNFPRTVEVTRNWWYRVGKGRGLFFFMKIENAWEEHSRWEPRTSLRCRTAVSTAICPLLVTAYGNCSPIVYIQLSGFNLKC